jgi:hypothetical protein
MRLFPRGSNIYENPNNFKSQTQTLQKTNSLAFSVVFENKIGFMFSGFLR